MVEFGRNEEMPKMMRLICEKAASSSAISDSPIRARASSGDPTMAGALILTDLAESAAANAEVTRSGV